MTDENGTHYLILRKDSEVLSGGIDPEGGFINLVRRRGEILGDVKLAEANRETHEDTATNFRWGTIGGFVGAAFCIWITGGTCLALVGLAGAAGWLSMSSDTEANLEENLVESYREYLKNMEGHLRFGFRVGQATEAIP